MNSPERPLSVFVVTAAVVASLLFGSPAHAATSTDRSVASAHQVADEKDPDEIRDKLSKIADAYEKGEARLGALTKRSKVLTAEAKATKARLKTTHERIAQMAEVSYVNGGVDPTLQALLSDGGAVKAAQRATMMSALTHSDDIVLRKAKRDQKSLSRQLADLATTKKKAFVEQRKLKKQRDALNKELRKVTALGRDSNGVSRGRIKDGFACPVGSPYTMMNTFGAPRGGGRSHEGVDIAAPKSTPIYAVEDGTIERAYSNTLGGIAIIQKGKSGDSYYYAHQEENLVQTGAQVKAGQQIARVGMTGDAMGTIFHLHFERWPGGGNAVDPWPFLLPLCGKKG